MGAVVDLHVDQEGCGPIRVVEKMGRVYLLLGTRVCIYWKWRVGVMWYRKLPFLTCTVHIWS